MRVVITVPWAPTQSPRSSAFDVGKQLVSDDRLGDEQLDVDAAVGDGEEHELAGVALEHHPTGDGDADVRLLAGAEVGSDGTHVGGAVRAFVAVGVRLAPGGAQLVDLPLAAGALGGEAAARRDLVRPPAPDRTVVVASARLRDPSVTPAPTVTGSRPVAGRWSYPAAVVVGCHRWRSPPAAARGGRRR